MVKTDHILFIASGAFHMSKPSDLIPELQGRLPIRVELNALTADDFVRIFTEPTCFINRAIYCFIRHRRRQYSIRWIGIERIAEFAWEMNESMENIGARRLHTVIERLLEEISFDASERNNQSIIIDKAYVETQLADLVKDHDLSQFIL